MTSQPCLREDPLPSRCATYARPSDPGTSSTSATALPKICAEQTRRVPCHPVHNSPRHAPAPLVPSQLPSLHSAQLLLVRAYSIRGAARWHMCECLQREGCMPQRYIADQSFSGRPPATEAEFVLPLFQPGCPHVACSAAIVPARQLTSYAAPACPAAFTLAGRPETAASRRPPVLPVPTPSCLHRRTSRPAAA